YIAIKVRDDDEVTGYGWDQTDAIEMYVEGTKRGRVVPQTQTVKKFAAIQYVMCPHGGSYDRQISGIEPQNPRMNNYDIKKTKTRCAYSREGSISIYEWLVEAFDVIPDVATVLKPGKTIGLDIVVNDKDGLNYPVWVCWGQFKAGKFFNADTLGDILLVESLDDIGTLTGVVRDKRDDDVFPEFEFMIYQENELFRYVKTDSDGRYRVPLPKGTYQLKPKSRQGVETNTIKKVTVRAGKEMVADFIPEPVKLPKVIEKAAGVYKNLKSYRDSTIIEVQTVTGTTKKVEILPYALAFRQPNLFRFESNKKSSLDNLSLYSDGKAMTIYKIKDNTYMQMPPPEKFAVTAIQTPVWHMTGSMIDLHFILSDNPLAMLLRNVDTLTEVGKEKLDGTTVSVIEITKPVTSMAPESILPIVTNYGLPAGDMPVTIRMWIGEKDYLIRKLSFSLDIDKLSESLPIPVRSTLSGTAQVTITHRAIEMNPSLTDAAFALKIPSGARLFMMSMPGRAVSRKPVEKDMDGTPAPDFSLKDIEGISVGLTDFKGNVVLLSFWASWSEPCVETLKIMQTIFEEYKGKGLASIGINTLEGEDADFVKSFIEDHTVTYSILIDPEDTIIEEYGVVKVPTCLVIDKQGNVRYTSKGKPETDILVKIVEELLGE
ncbi:redoxin domain-containing protein, partial [Candidatus Latescibacterota bacterium]